MQRGAEIKAGAFIVIGLVLFALFVWTLGSERQIFARQAEYHAHFKDVKGLAEGAPVRMGGLTVGRVSRISFAPQYKSPYIDVTLLINEDYIERIRVDSLVSIETQGLLGDRFVSVSMAAGQQLLPPGSKSVIPSVEPADIAEVLQKAGQIVDNTVKISENVNRFLGEKGEDALGNFARGAKTLADILQEVQTGQGILHNVIYAEDKGELLKNLSEALSDLNEIIGEVKSGKGLIHSLVFDKDEGELKAAAKNVAQLAADLSAIAVGIKDGKGLIHELIYAKSPQSIGELFVKFNQSADNLKKATDALASGKGTLGALLIDPQLYDNLVQITDGAKKSFLLRQAIKSSLSK